MKMTGIDISKSIYQGKEIRSEFTRKNVPNDGWCFLHSVMENIKRIGCEMDIHDLKTLLKIESLNWEEEDDMNGVGEDFEPMLIRLSDLFGVSVTVFVHIGKEYFAYRTHGEGKGSVQTEFYFELKNRHYSPLFPKKVNDKRCKKEVEMSPSQHGMITRSRG